LADVEADYPEIYYADDYEATTRRVARTATETGSTRTRRREAGMEDLATGDGADDLLLDDDENGAADVASRYDDENGFYIHASHDYIANRYEVFKALGRGSFGEVVRAFDHKHHRWVALKIVRSEDRFRRQAAEEVRMLQMLRDADGHGGGCHIVRMLDHFDFRRHPCIVFECLGIDLYEALRRRNFRGFPFGAARRAAVDIARCLCVLRRLGIIHCDLKPENVLLTVPERRGSGGPPTGANINVKVVDFGSSCFENDKLFVYVQSRFYRAPEVILGAGYGTPVDMWSLGCIVAELVTGRPLFAGEDETDQLTTHVELLGMPPASLLSRSKRAAQFFSSTTGLPRYCTVSTTASTPHDGAFSGETMPPRLMGSSNRSGTYRGPPGSKDLVAALMKISGREPGQALNHRHREYVDFVRRCLCWEPSLRMTPEEALCHSWIVQDSMLSGRPKVLTGACEGRVHHGRPGSHGDENIFS
jgi:dual specificity tyrosine-phosphorylation-regulated kinase 2/3/4